MCNWRADRVTPKQETFLKANYLWKEGLNRGQAADLIGRVATVCERWGDFLYWLAHMRSFIPAPVMEYIQGNRDSPWDNSS